MKKIKRLLEIKRQFKLAEEKRQRAEKKMVELRTEQNKVLATITPDEAKLYKERIKRACEL